MDLAKNAIDQPNIATWCPLVITADKQTKGRGRNGKSWFSPDGMGLYSAFVKPVDEYHEFITMWMGAAIVRELRSYTLLDIKQVGINDIYLANKKLGGILCEVYKGYLIVGVGLNVFKPMKIRNDLLEKAIWLNEFSSEGLLSRTDLIKVLEGAVIR